MSANLIALTVADHDELSELRARVADLEEAVGSLRRQLVAVRSHLDDVELSRELEAVR